MVAEGIDAAIRSGELTCLLGANGVGKSTLLRTLSAFQPKLGGEIMIAGKEIEAYTDKELSQTIGVVLTEKPDIRNMTVRELVALGRSPYTGFWGTLHDEDWQVVDEAIDAVRISSLRERMVHTLSDGERQKVMIAKALAQQTPVIFLDEPTAFLDFPSKVEMMQLLRRLAREAHWRCRWPTDFGSWRKVERGKRKVERGKRKVERGYFMWAPLRNWLRVGRLPGMWSDLGLVLMRKRSL